VKMDDGWKSLQQVNEWIRFADAKAVAILAASGLLGGLVVKAIPHYRSLAAHPVHTVLLGLAMVCIGASAITTLRTITPRLRAGEARSLLYFEHIAKRYSADRAGFVENFLNLLDDDARLARQVGDQLWANSLVARGKFRRVAYATWFLSGGMIFAGTAVLADRLWNW